MTFQPGDQILLKSGDTFTTEMFVDGSGTPSSYLTVASYGSGAMPIISGNDDDTSVAMNLYDDSYVEIEGLAVEDAGTGILIDDATNQTGYRFLNLYLSGDGSGIQSLTGVGTASNVLVQDVTGASNTLGCQVSPDCPGSTLLLAGVSNVIVDRLFTYSNCAATLFGVGGAASDILVENSESLYDGDCDDDEGSTADFLEDASNVTYVNDIIADVPEEWIDESGIDIEPNTGPDSGINIEGDYIADNAGPGIEIIDHPYPITNVNISGNVLWDNGANYVHIPVFQAPFGQIWTDSWTLGNPEATGSITDNLYDAPTGTGGFEQSQFYANFNDFTQSDNIDASGPDDVWYAANGFSCSVQGANQWSFQSSVDGSTWKNLSGCVWANALDEEWSNGGTSSGFVSNFEELPPTTTTSWVARSWTAPASGSVSIRGMALMSDPTCSSGATLEITENGSSTPIWGPETIPAGDDAGINTNLDAVNVNAGDVLHFAVQGDGSSQCRVSWTPSVGYPNPVTTVVLPSGGQQLSGTVTLDASASDSASPIGQLHYVLTGGSLNDAVIANATETEYGWVGFWNASTVPNGTYTLQSVATDTDGNVGTSPGVTVVVDNPPPTTSVLIPAAGASVSGSQVVLDASASDPAGVAKVQYELIGGSYNDTVIANATATEYGWLALWNASTVPNGTYTLQSVATDTDGNVGTSPGVTVVVDNPPPTTSVLIPAAGASVSGSQVVLDASASDPAGVAKVQYELIGGSYNDTVIANATATEYGWLALWNASTVPNGTYTLQSVATDAGGNVGTSPGVTVVVDN